MVEGVGCAFVFGGGGVVGEGFEGGVGLDYV